MYLCNSWKTHFFLFISNESMQPFGIHTCIQKYFPQIFLFTAELSHFLGTQNSKKYFCTKNIFEKMFLEKNIFFEFCVLKKWLSSAVKKQIEEKKNNNISGKILEKNKYFWRT